MEEEKNFPEDKVEEGKETKIEEKSDAGKETPS